jgi:hypothetical protein
LSLAYLLLLLYPIRVLQRALRLPMRHALRMKLLLVVVVPLQLLSLIQPN